jgi:hypothetical protein
MSLPTTGDRKFANFDPQFCGKVAKIAAAVCAVLVLCAVIVLTTVDPASTRCPGWLMFPESGRSDSIWILVSIAAPAAAWLCFVAVCWGWCAQRMIGQMNWAEEALASDPKAGLFSDGDRFKALCTLFIDTNLLMPIVCLGWAFFCSIPLLVIAAKCA